MVPLSGSDVSAQDIEQLLRTLGASPVYAGFTPAVTALQYVLADQQLLTSLTTRLYPKVAESCEIALPCVERNIRTMIAVIWEKNQFLFQIVVGYRMTARPSVGDFLASLSTFLWYIRPKTGRTICDKKMLSQNIKSTMCRLSRVNMVLFVILVSPFVLLFSLQSLYHSPKCLC